MDNIVIVGIYFMLMLILLKFNVMAKCIISLSLLVKILLDFGSICWLSCRIGVMGAGISCRWVGICWNCVKNGFNSIIN